MTAPVPPARRCAGLRPILGAPLPSAAALCLASPAWAADKALGLHDWATVWPVLLAAAAFLVGLLLSRWLMRDRPAAAGPQMTTDHSLRERAIRDAPLPVMLHADDGAVLSVNEEWALRTGFAAGEITSVRDWSRRAFGDDRIRVHDGSGDVYEQASEKVIQSVAAADGRVLWWEFRSRPLGRLADGRRAALTVVNDITEQRGAEQQLKDSEARYRIISELTSDIVYAYEVAPDGRVGMRWQVGGIKGLVGDAGSGAEPLAWLTRVHPDDVPIIESRDQRLCNGLPSTDEFRLLSGDGRVRWLRVYSRPEKDDTGAVVRVIGAAKEITQDKRWEEALADSESKLQATSRTAGVGYWEYYPDGDRIVCSPVMWRIWGLRPGRTGPRGRVFLDVLHADDRPVVEAILQDPPETLRHEYRIVRPDGSQRQVFEDLSVDRDGDGRAVRFFGVCQDVTDIRQVQADLADAKEEAEQASAAKTRFLAAASHDLRQPLQALAMFVNVLSDRDLDAKAKDLVKRVRDCSDALERLLGSLLDISRLDAGLFVPQRRDFDLGDCLERLCVEMLPLAEEKGLDLRFVPCRITVQSDPGLLDRLIRNLLSNAVRHTARGRILVGVRRVGLNVNIEIFDTGVGIPEDQLEMIFEEFHQVGNPARDRREGLGLGLAIVRRLSTLLDHPVGVTSVEGKGSRFTVQLPRADVVVGAVTEESPPSSPDVAGALVVGIDDEGDIRDALEMLLQGWGYQSIVAESAVEAMTLLETSGRSPDLVVADYRLKRGHTGADAIMAIRHVWGHHVPGFLLTGDTGPDRLREAAGSGFRVLHKPIQPDTLRRMVADTIRARRPDTWKNARF